MVTTLTVPDCLNLVQHLHPRCLEDRFVLQQTRKKGTAIALSLQRICSHLPALRLPRCAHLLAMEIHRQMTAQSSPCKLFVFNLAPACPDCLAPQRPGTHSRHSATTSSRERVHLVGHGGPGRTQVKSQFGSDRRMMKEHIDRRSHADTCKFHIDAKWIEYETARDPTPQRLIFTFHLGPLIFPP